MAPVAPVAASRDKVMEGLDASRRAAWRKFYEMEAAYDEQAEALEAQIDATIELYKEYRDVLAAVQRLAERFSRTDGRLDEEDKLWLLRRFLDDLPRVPSRLLDDLRDAVGRLA